MIAVLRIVVENFHISIKNVFVSEIYKVFVANYLPDSSYFYMSIFVCTINFVCVVIDS